MSLSSIVRRIVQSPKSQATYGPTKAPKTGKSKKCVRALVLVHACIVVCVTCDVNRFRLIPL